MIDGESWEWWERIGLWWTDMYRVTLKRFANCEMLLLSNVWTSWKASQCYPEKGNFVLCKLRLGSMNEWMNENVQSKQGFLLQSVMTLMEMSPRGSVMNPGNAMMASRAFSLMWIIRAETLTRKCTLYCRIDIRLGAYTSPRQKQRSSWRKVT